MNEHNKTCTYRKGWLFFSTPATPVDKLRIIRITDGISIEEKEMDASKGSVNLDMLSESLRHQN